MRGPSFVWDTWPVIRSAGPADLDLVLGLCEEFCAVDGHPFDATTYRTALAPLLGPDGPGRVWIVGDGDGYVVVTWGWSLESGGLDALVDEIYVRPQGEGLGRAAMEAILPELADLGARRVFLETERPNEGARRLYRRLGFAEEDSTWMSRTL